MRPRNGDGRALDAEGGMHSAALCSAYVGAAPWRGEPARTLEARFFDSLLDRTMWVSNGI